MYVGGRTLLVLSPGEAGVAQTCADGQDVPALNITHVRKLAQALDHSIVVQNDDGFGASNDWQGRANAFREVEAVRLSVTGKVLRTAGDGAVRADLSGATDPNERSEPNIRRHCFLDQPPEHVGQALHGPVSWNALLRILTQGAWRGRAAGCNLP